MGEDTTRELIEKRLNEGLEQLGQLEANDPKRPAKINEVKTLADTLNNLDKVENERLNNNEKNSIEEEKVRNEIRKLDIEQKKIKISGWQIIFGIVGGFLINTWGFVLNENMQPERRFERLSEKCTDLVQKVKL